MLTVGCGKGPLMPLHVHSLSGHPSFPGWCLLHVQHDASHAHMVRDCMLMKWGSRVDQPFHHAVGCIQSSGAAAGFQAW